jgi:hypothetical protein
MALAVLLLSAKAKFPVPLASAVLLLNATAMPEPVVVAVLLPNCTTVFPETETARPPLVVACDELVSSGEALASAHADGAPMPSATRGAPAHTAINDLVAFAMATVFLTRSPSSMINRGR